MTSPSRAIFAAALGLASSLPGPTRITAPGVVLRGPEAVSAAQGCPPAITAIAAAAAILQVYLVRQTRMSRSDRSVISSLNLVNRHIPCIGPILCREILLGGT